MRVVFTGPTGCEKDGVAAAVALEAAKNRGLALDLDDPETKEQIQVFSIEHEIRNAIGDLRPFLDQIHARERSRWWKEAMEKVLSRVTASKHTILSLHNVFFRRGNFFSCVDWDLLCAYKPTVFVTLINDVYDVWETINAREKEFKTNSYLHLPEILAWRSAEISQTQTLAENLYAKSDSYGITQEQLAKLRHEYPNVDRLFGKAIPHFVFAVKHPVRTLYQLLFRRDLPITYASFPITTPRNEPDSAGRQEIDAYRQRLIDSGFLTVIDPLTIDELRLTDTLAANDSLRPRWPMELWTPMVAEVPLTMNPFEGYSQFQFDAFKSSVARHVEARDYQLVSQSTIVAAYRPFYGGPLGSNARPSVAPSGGVEKELSFAVAESKLTYAVHPPEDRREGVRVFRTIDFTVQPETIDALLSQLEKFAGHASTQAIPRTWERP